MPITMFFCCDCQREFTDDSAIMKYERGEAWGVPYASILMCCPYCGSSEITDDYCHCNRCGKASIKLKSAGKSILSE